MGGREAYNYLTTGIFRIEVICTLSRGATPQFVVCKVLVCLVGAAPVRPSEFIVLRITVQTAP